MKKFFAITAVSLLLATSATYAQKKNPPAAKTEKAAKSAAKDVDSAMKQMGKDIKKATKKAGDDVAETASKGAAKITDKEYKGKTGPNGQTIYIDSKSKYYWVDDKGHHQYIAASQLKNKQ